MAKIAVELQCALRERQKTGAAGNQTARVLAQGSGWIVSDVVCTAGPKDQPFEELHSGISIGIVAAGTFQYRAGSSVELMTPGSFLVGSLGQYFECSHEYGAGDRCVAFWYAPDYFERIAADTGIALKHFRHPRVPPLRAIAPLVARACAGLVGSAIARWEELAIEVAARTLQSMAEVNPNEMVVTKACLARVSHAARTIEDGPDDPHSIEGLARAAGLSPYHFLRVFHRLTGLTPHQYIMRTRLREAATCLASDKTKVIEIALGSGFGDVSNFNRAFRAEFGVSPRAYRTKGFDPQKGSLAL